MNQPTLVLWSGLFIGLVFGAVGQRTGFCLTSGLRHWWLASDGRRIRAFAVALAVAVVTAQIADAQGLVALNRSLYLQPALPWPLLAMGGVIFGYGMVLANGCGARALVLLGSGNLRSFVVLVCLGIAAYVTLSGVLAPVRVWLASALSVGSPVGAPTLYSLFSSLGPSADLARWIVVAVVAAILTVFALSDRQFRGSPRYWIGGLVVGVLIVAGWLATGYLGADDFDPVPVASLTFVAPIGESIQYLMLSTGTALRFAVAVVGGVVGGSLIASLATGSFKLESFNDPKRTLRYMCGGAMMGIGGVLSLGCSIGQGLTGLSTLSLGSFIAAAGIVLGALMGYRGPLKAAPV